MRFPPRCLPLTTLFLSFSECPPPFVITCWPVRPASPFLPPSLLPLHLVFFSGFFQASCHTTANSWNSCPTLASNKRLQEGDQAADSKQSHLSENEDRYFSTCPAGWLLTDSRQVSSYKCFVICATDKLFSGLLSEFKLPACWISHMCRNSISLCSLSLCPSHSISETTFLKYLTFLRANSCIFLCLCNASSGASVYFDFLCSSRNFFSSVLPSERAPVWVKFCTERLIIQAVYSLTRVSRLDVAARGGGPSRLPWHRLIVFSLIKTPVLMTRHVVSGGRRIRIFKCR